MDAPRPARGSQTSTADDREQAFLAFLRNHLTDDGSSPVAMPGLPLAHHSLAALVPRAPDPCLRSDGQ